MNSNPINRAVQFLLEIFSLTVIGIWRWKQSDNWERHVAIGLPVIGVVIWEIFALANDPSLLGNAANPPFTEKLKSYGGSPFHLRIGVTYHF